MVKVNSPLRNSCIQSHRFMPLSNHSVKCQSTILPSAVCHNKLHFIIPFTLELLTRRDLLLKTVADICYKIYYTIER